MLGYGGIANSSDFAVLEIRNRGQHSCAMRSAVTVTGLDRHGLRTRGVPELRSDPAPSPIVLSAAGSDATSPAGAADGLGILMSGGNAIGMGGCPAVRVLRPWAWRVAIGDHRVTLRNSTRSVAASLTACRLPGQGFHVGRQTRNSQLPVQPHPA